MNNTIANNTFTLKHKISDDLSWNPEWPTFYENILKEENKKSTSTIEEEDLKEEKKAVPIKGNYFYERFFTEVRTFFDSRFFFTKPKTAEFVYLYDFPIKKLGINNIEGISMKKENAFRINSAYMKKKKKELKELRLKYGIER